MPSFIPNAELTAAWPALPDFRAAVAAEPVAGRLRRAALGADPLRGRHAAGSRDHHHRTNAAPRRLSTTSAASGAAQAGNPPRSVRAVPPATPRGSTALRPTHASRAQDLGRRTRVRLRVAHRDGQRLAGLTGAQFAGPVLQTLLAGRRAIEIRLHRNVGRRRGSARPARCARGQSPGHT